MKNVFYLALCFIAGACAAPPAEDASSEGSSESVEKVAEERSIGFTTANPDWKFYLGTEEAIDVVKEVDRVWAARDFDALAGYFTDTTWFHWADGRRMDNPEDFLNTLKAENNPNVSWETTGMFSVDFNPDTGGEHVRAGFRVTVVSDEGDTTRSDYLESYYVVQGKIIHWRQWKMNMEPAN